jgi:hypothetical protein
VNLQQNNLKKVYRASSTIKIRNPKLEIRNKLKIFKPNYEIRNDPVWNFVFFDHLELFRISDFEFRASVLSALLVLLGGPFGFAQDMLCAFRSTWLMAVSVSNRARVIIFPILQFQNSS